MKTVILPVAGKGTRLLPLTKSVSKELLPVYDKPVLQFAIDEAVAAGAERLVVISHESKPDIASYFHTDKQAIAALRQKNKAALADCLENTGASGAIDVVITYQKEALGLGHAVLCASEHLLDGPVGVILPDDVILGRPCLPEMKAAYTGGNMVAAMDVAREDISKYGAFDVRHPDGFGVAIPAAGMVEKPNPEDAPSTLAAVGRYILDAGIFSALRNIPRGAGGEYQLTDAIASMTFQVGLSALRFSGTRFDCGHHNGLLTAANARFKQVNAKEQFVMAAE